MGLPVSGTCWFRGIGGRPRNPLLKVGGSDQLTGLLALILLGAAPQTASLQYAFAPSSLRCPDEAWVKNAIRARLGRDPFSPDARLLLSARIHPEGDALAADLVVQPADGPTTTRHLVSASNDCFELASALELAMTVVIDPLWLSVPEPRPEPPPAPRPPPPPGRGPELSLLARLVGTAGATPGATAGLGLGAKLRWSTLELGLDARVHWPTRVLFAGGEVSTVLARASLEPCVGLRNAVSVCGVVAGGLIRITGATSVVTRVTVPYASAGAAVYGHFVVLRRYPLQPFVAAELLLPRLTVASGPTDLWVSWPLAATLGLSGELPIP